MDGLIRRQSPGAGGDAPQGLDAAQSYSEVPEVKHNKNCQFLRHKSSSSEPAQYALPATLAPFLFIYNYVLHTKFRGHATFYHSENCLWIKLLHSMHLTEFTANPMITDCTRVFTSLRQGSLSSRCLPSGLFSLLQL